MNREKESHKNKKPIWPLMVGLLIVFGSFIPLIIVAINAAPEVNFNQYAENFWIAFIPIALFFTLPLLIVGIVIIKKSL